MAKPKTLPIERKHYTPLFFEIFRKPNIKSKEIAKNFSKNEKEEWYHAQINISAQLKNLNDINIILKNGNRKDATYSVDYKGIIEYMFKTYSKEAISLQSHIDYDFLDTDDFSELKTHLENYFQILSNAYIVYNISEFTLKEIIEGFMIGFNLKEQKHLDYTLKSVKKEGFNYLFSKEYHNLLNIKSNNTQYEFKMKFFRLCNNFVHNHLHKQSILSDFAITILND